MDIPAQLKVRAVRLFDGMDAAYDQAAAESGFVCNGCENNCCRTRFYHHTLLESILLRQAMAQLPSDQSRQLRQQAAAAIHQAADMRRRGGTVRVMCPLNQKGRCVLYAQRPMICRMHGIPHTLQRPDGQRQDGPGCDDFYLQCGKADHSRLDRTPHYVALAQLERQLRREVGFNQKIKMTIAEIIV